MSNDANTLARAGLPGPTAIEIARQMAAGTPNGKPERLMAVGIPAMPAVELARQINAGVFSAALLAAAMWNPAVAVVLKAESGL